MADDTRVIDGDTLVTPGGERVRFYGVDTPEITKRTGEENQPGGLEAKLATEHLIQDGYTLGESEGETYGRHVREVYGSDGRSVSNSLLENGLASVPGNRNFSDTQHRIASLGALFPRKDEDPTMKALRESAQESRNKRLMAFAQGARDATLLGATGKYIPEEGVVSRAWDRGVAELKATGNGFLTAIGDYAGIDAASESGRAGLTKAMIEAMENPADIASYEDVDSLAEAGTYALETFVSTSPGLISDAALAALGAVTGGGTVALAGVGKAFLRSAGGAAAVGEARSITAKAAAKAGAKLGAAGSMYGQNTGETQMGFMQQGIDDPASALGVGAAKTALDYISLKGTLGDTLGAGGDTLLDTFKSIGKATGAGTLRESSTEALQSDFDERAKEHLADNGYTYDSRNVAEGAIAGAIVGGTLSGAGSTATGLTRHIGNADQAAPTDGDAAEAPADSPDAPTITRTRQWNDGVPTPDSPVADTAAEPPSSLIAQAAQRGFTYVAPSNVSDGVSVDATVEALGPNAVVRPLENGGAIIGTDQAAIEALPDNPTEAEMAEALGYDGPKPADPATSVSVRELDDDGNVVKSQAVAEERVPFVLGEAQKRGARTEVLPLTEEVSQRQQRYQSEVEALRAARPADTSLTPDRVDTTVPGQQAEEAAPVGQREIRRDGPNRSMAEIAEQASSLGLETDRYVGSVDQVDLDVLRHNLQSRMREAVPGNENVTLRERVGDRDMSQLSDPEVMAVADMMGVAELPKRLGTITKGRARMRSTAISSIATKVGQLTRGSRQSMDGTSEAVFAPANVDALATFLPELQGLNRREFDSTAAYQAAVRRAMPTQTVLRKRLSKMSSSALYHANQVLRTGYKIPEGVEFEQNQQTGDIQRNAVTEKPEGIGSAITALSPTRDQAPAPAPEIDRAAPGYAPNAEAGRPGVSRETEALPEENEARIEAAQADAVETREDDGFDDGDSLEATAALVGAAYAGVTGDGNGAKTRLAMQAAYPNMSPERVAQADVTKLDGARALLAAIKEPNDTDEQALARFREWHQLALDNPRQFAEEVSDLIRLKDIRAKDYAARAPSTKSSLSGEVTANGISDTPNVAAGLSGTGVEFEGGIEVSEQESSDGLFFNGTVEGARFIKNEEGQIVPAGTVNPTSTAPHHRQRVSSLDTANRLKARNLATLPVVGPNQQPGNQIFDIMALAAHAQSGLGRPRTPVQALDNLTANLSRMAAGPVAETLQSNGPRQSNIQGLAPEAAQAIPPGTVIFETEDGREVTYGEALATKVKSRNAEGDATEIANRVERLNQQQADRRAAIRPLIERAIGALDSMQSDERVATAADINRILGMVYNDGLEQDTVVAAPIMDSLTDAEQYAVVADLRDTLSAQEQTLEALNRRMETTQAELEKLEAELLTVDGETRKLTELARDHALHAIRTGESSIGRAKASIIGLRRQLENAPTHMPVEGRTEPANTPKVNRYKSRISRFVLSDKQAEAMGVGDARTLDTLATQYRNVRNELFTLTNTLREHPRTPSDVPMGVDTVARELYEAGMEYDEARAEAERYVERSGTLMAGNDGDATTIADDVEPTGDAMVDGTPSQLAVNEDGTITSAPMPQQDSEDASGNAAQNEAQDAEEREARRRIQQRSAETDAKVAAFKQANGITESENKTLEDNAPLAPGALSLYGSPVNVRTPYNSIAQQQMLERARKSGIEGGVPVNDRVAKLNAVFGDKGIHVRGSVESEAVSSFVTSALADFRSTDRPVLVMVGEDAASIGRFLNDKGLVGKNRLSRASQMLEEAGAGRKALYMPMGDFVLVSMPEHSATAGKGESGAQRGYFEWYHKLGHELGHVVYDDYAMSLERNKTLRDRVKQSYQNETGLAPNDDPNLFKEWFADKTANEMIRTQTREEQSDPAFVRVANLMRGFFNRIQKLIGVGSGSRYTRSRSFEVFAEAIRSGQVQRDRGLATPDFQFEGYDGKAARAASMGAQRVKAGVGRMKGPSSFTRRLLGTVVGRMEAYNQELGQRLFQRSASDRPKGMPQAWQQMANALRDRNVGAFTRTVARLTAGMKKKDATAAIRQGLLDLERGRRTAASQELATLIDSAIADAEAKGLRSVSHPENFVPAAIDHTKVDGNRDKFTAIMRQAFPNESDAQIHQRTTLLLDNHGMSQYAIAPGLPVSMHETTRVLMDVARAELREAGFLAEPSEAVLYHWMDGLAKRTAWEANFGDYTREVSSPIDENRRLMGIDDPQGVEARRRGLMNEDGRYFDPNGRFNALVDQAAATHGPEARTEILGMLDGVMGRTTSAMPRNIRNVNDWVTAWTGWTVLAFSGVASIPELGLGAVRAHGRAGLLDGVRGYAEARRYAKDMGIVLGDAAEQIMWQSMGDNYESPLLNKMGTAFFKYNGQKFVTDASRTMSTSIAMRYLVSSVEANDTQALEQLGVTAAEVRAWDNAGRPAWQPGVNTADNAVAEKIGAAINQFVYEGSTMPSKLQNPSWFNNPWLKSIWMIKRYMYAYGEGILGGMWRQTKRQWNRDGLTTEQKAFMAAAPAMTFAVATLPLAAAGTELREWIQGRDKSLSEYGGWPGYAKQMFSRAGGFGPLELVLNAKQQSDWGASPIGAISPVAAKAEMWFDWGSDNSASMDEFWTKLVNSTPGLAQAPRSWNTLFE